MNMNMIKVIFLVAFIGSACNLKGWAQAVDYDNVPEEIQVKVATAPFNERYEVVTSINPFYLRGDFDGDGKPDYATRIKAIKGGQLGIAVWLTSQRRFVLIGAGNEFKAGGATTKSLDFIDYWQVYGRRSIERGVGEGVPPRLLGEAILAGKKESASGLIYWNGKQFVWYQRGD